MHELILHDLLATPTTIATAPSGKEVKTQPHNTRLNVTSTFGKHPTTNQTMSQNISHQNSMSITNGQHGVNPNHVNSSAYFMNVNTKRTALGKES